MAFPSCCQAPPDIHIKLVFQVRTKTFEFSEWGDWSSDITVTLGTEFESAFFDVHQGPEPYFSFYAAEVQFRFIYDASPSCYLAIAPVATYNNLDGSFNSYLTLATFTDDKGGSTGMPCWKAGLDFTDLTTWWHLPADDSLTGLSVPGDGSIAQIIWNDTIVRP